MIAYLKARLAEVSSKFGALLAAVVSACGVANAYGEPWAKIAFGASLLGAVVLVLRPEKPAVTLHAADVAQAMADQAQATATKVAASANGSTVADSDGTDGA